MWRSGSDAKLEVWPDVSLVDESEVVCVQIS